MVNQGGYDSRLKWWAQWRCNVEEVDHIYVQECWISLNGGHTVIGFGGRQAVLVSICNRRLMLF